MQTVIPLQPGEVYHIYNRGANRTDLFLEDRNYAFFMQLYAKHVVPVAETFAYCLTRNHFHLLVRIRTERLKDLDRLGFRNRVGLEEAGPSGPGLDPTPDLNGLSRRAVSQAFNNWFNAYAKAFNKACGRTGSLFQHHFGRLLLTSDRYFAAVIHYIHFNPQKHGFVKDFRNWPHSSYRALLSQKPTRLERDTVLSWFGGREGFRRLHAMAADESFISEFLGEDEF